MTVLTYALAAMTLLAPGRDHAELGDAIAHVLDEAPPLFRDDEDRRRTTALLVAILFREGSLGLHVEGDVRAGRATSWCTAQIHLPGGAITREGWTGPELRDEPRKCVAVAVRKLRESIQVSARTPVAVYAAGSRWRSARAQRISRDRAALAEWILRETNEAP